MHIKKRTAILMWSFIVGAFGILLGFLIKTNICLMSCKNTVKTTYRESCAQIAESLLNVDYALQKCAYATTPSQAVTFASEVWKEAGTAKACLENLPVYELNLVNTSKFFNQVGEYALSLAKKTADGDTITAEETENLAALSSSARKLASAMIEMEYAVSSDNLCCDDLVKYFKDPGVSDNAVQTSAGMGGAAQAQSSNPFVAVENTLDYPALNYDGAYSDHLYALRSVLTEGKDEISQEEARKRAAYVLGCRVSDLDEGNSVAANGVDLWLFTGDGKSVSITKNGGYLCEFGKYRAVGDVSVTDKDAEKAAEDFLDKIEIRSMTKTFTSSAGNILTIDYCYSDGGVLCYPDVIRVAVALDNGEILSYSAYEYVMSHMPSRDVSAKITEAEATANIPSGLELVGARLVVIATNSYSSREKLCWEVTCTNKAGEAVMIYVNALNGRQEDIKILYSNENMSKLK